MLARRDAINTVLAVDADKREEEEDQQTRVVTFDQPLYAKAVEMIANYQPVAIRLGGFHLIMSCMDVVGYIMGGSGLKEVWSVI